jgi:hypothetical protein
MRLEDLTIKKAFQIIESHPGGRWSGFRESDTWKGGGVELWFPRGCPEEEDVDPEELDHVYLKYRSIAVVHPDFESAHECDHGCRRPATGI